MASKARKAFNSSSAEVQQLLRIHAQLGGSAPGRRQLEVLNKAAIVLITALWEAYCEDVAAEGLELIVAKAATADVLPKTLKQRMAKELKTSPHELSPWELADDGWRAKARARLVALTEERNLALNTPKTSQIDDLFAQALGIASVSTAWRWRHKSAKDTAKELDRFVRLRGSIAHRGVAQTSVRKKDVKDFLDLVDSLISKTGATVNQFVKGVTGHGLW